MPMLNSEPPGLPLSEPEAEAPIALPLLRLRVTLRLLADAGLPPHKGSLLRGGFGHAFQHASCPRACWGRSEQCDGPPCPFRRVFAGERPHAVAALHDLQDVPRPFVIVPPLDTRTRYQAGEAIEFGLTLIGAGIDHLPYFLFGFEQFGQYGLGRDRAPARMERVEALRPWQVTGVPVYQDGRALEADAGLPLIGWPQIATRAAALPENLRLALRTPLRIKAGGTFVPQLDPAALVQAACWRLNALATFHGAGSWQGQYRPLVEQARTIRVEQAQLRWENRERMSRRGEQPQRMQMGGLVGSVALHGVPRDVRTVLLAGSLVQVGKATVMGNGVYEVSGEH